MFGVQGIGFGAWGCASWVERFGFRIQGLGLRVEGLGRHITGGDMYVCLC